MKIHMSAPEITQFLSFLKCASSYLEFGAGGSTVLASEHVNGPIVSIESSNEWIELVKANLPESPHERRVIHGDVGPVGSWGTPTLPHGEVNYFNYHERPWLQIDQDFDLYFVDGRFRIACFCQCLLRAPDGAVIGIHDYRPRKRYHVVETLARPIAEVETLTFFTRRPNVPRAQITQVLSKFALDPN